MGTRIKARINDRPLRVGVISDTHGVLHPDVDRIFARVDHILHAGDVGSATVLEELARLAPVTAIRGNADPPTIRLPACRRVDLGGLRVLLVHQGLTSGGRTTVELERGLCRYRPAIAVFGHSHMPLVEWRDGVLLVNPGGGGRRRFRLPRSVALVSIGARAVRARVVVLDSDLRPLSATRQSFR
jgi:putative phosphoesterase